MDGWILFGALLVTLTFGVVFFGAPFVPTKRRDIEAALDLAGLEPNALVVDLGSGDGRVLLAASRRGFRGIGYELSPVFAAISRVRLRSHRKRVQIRIRNFWHQQLPDDTAVVFVFLAGPFMKKLARYMQAEADRQGRTLSLVSYGFALPGFRPHKTRGPLSLYVISPTPKA